MSSRAKAKTLKWYFVGFCFLSTFGWIFVLFTSSGSTFEPRPNDRPVADVTQTSPEIEEVAATLRAEGFYVDPLLADTSGSALLGEPVRAALDGSATDVFLMAVPTFGFDPTADDVLLARIANATDRDGVYVLYDEDGNATHLTRGVVGEQVNLYPVDSSESEVLQLVSEVDEAVEREEKAEEASDWAANPLVMGLFMGVTFSVPLWYLMKFIRWSARRDHSYLKGFQ